MYTTAHCKKILSNSLFYALFTEQRFYDSCHAENTSEIKYLICSSEDMISLICIRKPWLRIIYEYRDIAGKLVLNALAFQTVMPPMRTITLCCMKLHLAVSAAEKKPQRVHYAAWNTWKFLFGLTAEQVSCLSHNAFKVQALSDKTPYWIMVIIV